MRAAYVPPRPVTSRNALAAERSGCSRGFIHAAAKFADGDNQIVDALSLLAGLAVTFPPHFLELFLVFAETAVPFQVASIHAEPDRVDMTAKITFTNQVFFPVLFTLFDVGGIQKFKPLDAFVDSHLFSLAGWFPAPSILA